MKSPLKIGAFGAPKDRLLIKAGRTDSGKARRIASLSAAGAMVLGVAAGSALFVDYLADRALARGTEGPVVVTPVVAKSMDSSAEVSVASVAVQPARPAVASTTPQPAPIEARLPDASAVAKVTAVGPEHAIEVPSADPTAEPIVQFDDMAEVEEIGVEDPSDETMTGAISPDEIAPEPAQKRKKVAKAKAEQPAKAETEIASLPGVNIGGLAGYAAEDDDTSSSTVRTAVKPAQPVAAGAVAGTARVTQAVNMRSGPNKGASALGVVPASSTVKVISCDGWCKISWNGRTGFVYKNFLAATKQKNAAVEKPARKVSSSRL